MSDHKDPKLNSAGDDLIDVKALIRDAAPASCTLEDILAEYGATPKPALRPTHPGGGKVVAFPGTAVLPPPEEEEPRNESPEESPPGEEPEPEEEQTSPPPPDPPAGEDEPEEDGEELSAGQVIPFPEPESGLSAVLKDLSRRADDFAERMFEEDENTDREEVRRLERLIPGTDLEEPEEELDLRRSRPPRRQEPPPPDTPPLKLAQRYGRGLRGMRVRALLVLLLAGVCLLQTLFPMTGADWPAPLDQPQNQLWLSVGLLGAGCLLAFDLLFVGLVRVFRLRVGMDTLALLSCAFTLADGVQLALAGEGGRLPYTLVCLFGLFFQLHGSYHKRCGLRLSCRTAGASASPYRVTLEEGKWNGRDTYAKWPGTQEGFGSQIQTDDGVQRVFRVVCPLLLLGSVCFSLLASVGREQPDRLVWCLSALFTASAAFGGTLAYGRPFHKLARRLSQIGAALAGWPGMSGSRRADRVLLTDADLFPPGYVSLNGFRVMPDFPSERVVAYAATLIRDSGSGLAKLFHDQLRSMGGLMRRAEGLKYYEGGGLSGNIRGDSVLVGSAAFMKLMEIPLPQGLNVKNAVFCAVNGELAGIFALNYPLPDTVFPALEELLLERVGPVLATRDFNLIPAMLQQRFKLAADRMDFPSVERRRELSDPEQEHGGPLTALLCREGLLPFAESVTASRRLRRAARLGAALCCAGSALGLLLCAYLTSVGAYTSLSPLHLLIYMFTWLAPVWFLSGWAHQF